MTTPLPNPLAVTLSRRFEPVPHEYGERDTSLYALAVGAGDCSPSSSTSQSTSNELAFYYPGAPGFAPLPTFPCTLPYFGVTAAVPFEEIVPNFSPMGVLHGEQFVYVPRPLPPQARVETEPRVVSVSDKGKAAVVVLSATTRDATSRSSSKKRLLCYQELTVFVRGSGGFGGGGEGARRRPAAATAANDPPSRPPDDAFEQRLPLNAAALYSLTGDENPLHVDPEFASMAGYDRPILHGLCTLAYGVRAVINSPSSRAGCSGDASIVRTVKGRMASHVFPGETLRTEMWRLRPGEGGKRDARTKPTYEKVVFVVSVKERGRRVITGAAVEVGEPEREGEEEDFGRGDDARAKL